LISPRRWWRFTHLIATFRGDIGSIGAVLVSDSRFWTQLSCGKPAFVEDQALHVMHQIGQHDLGLGPLDADGVVIIAGWYYSVC
jgi:hypothetical protein